MLLPDFYLHAKVLRIDSMSGCVIIQLKNAM